MAVLCAEDNIAMTPYSSLASGRLSRKPNETSKRAVEDSYAKFKYDATKEQDEIIIGRVAEIQCSAKILLARSRLITNRCIIEIDTKLQSTSDYFTGMFLIQRP